MVLVQLISLSLNQFNNVPVVGTIYEMYRVFLAMLEVKVMITQRGICAIQDNEDDYETFPANENLVSLMKPLVMIPDQISSMLNNIGQDKVGDNSTSRKSVEPTEQHKIYLFLSLSK